MKRHNVLMVALAGASCAFVVLAAVLVRNLGEEAYARYVGRGGAKGFWAWFARDLCGVPVPGVAAADDEPGVKRQAAEEAAYAKAAEAAREQARLDAAKREKAERKARAREEARRSKSAAKSAKSAKRKRAGAAKKRGGRAVKTGGKSSYVAGNDKSPYRVTGIQGIEFGSSDNAPAEGVKPIMSVAYDDEGNAEFRGLKWRETKPLTEPVYGFDKAALVHSYDTEQLSSVTFAKNFPFTEEGLQQAVDFYKTMSAEASSDLGFEVIDIDRTDNLKSATVCEFKNGDSDTAIRGAISAYGDKTLSVTFSVTDKAYARETSAQSAEAYRSGVADGVDARVEVVGRDHTAQKERINAYLGE